MGVRIAPLRFKRPTTHATAKAESRTTREPGSRPRSHAFECATGASSDDTAARTTRVKSFRECEKRTFARPQPRFLAGAHGHAQSHARAKITEAPRTRYSLRSAQSHDVEAFDELLLADKLNRSLVCVDRSSEPLTRARQLTLGKGRGAPSAWARKNG